MARRHWSEDGIYTIALDYWWLLLALALIALFPVVRALPGKMLLAKLWSWLRPQYGQAKWARLRDLRFAGLLRPDGLFLGHARGHDLFLPAAGDGGVAGEECILTIAPRGAGKTSGLVVPTLITLREGSVVLTDPKGELAAMTKRHRETLSEVVMLNPWREDMKIDLGTDLGGTDFNPLSIIKDGRSLSSDARTFASYLIPDNPNANNPYWWRSGQGLVATLIYGLVRVAEPGQCTLPRLFELLNAGDGLRKFLKLLTENDDPALKAYAKGLHSLCKSGGGQWVGVLGEAQTAVDIYAPGSELGQHVSVSGFDPADLKRKDMSVYIVIPIGRTDSHKAWLNLVVTVIAEAVGKPGLPRPVLLLLDEFQNLGKLPRVQTAMGAYRSAGLRVWMIAQTAGRLLELYGADGVRDLWGQTDIKQFFAVNDPALAKEISNWLGQKTVSTTTVSGGGQESFGQTGMPLMFPEQVMRMKPGQQIIFKGGGKGISPIRAELVPYYKRRAWRRLVDPNPYRRSWK